VDANGVITTVAGNGAYAYSGDGALATGATFEYPYAVAVDAAGNVAVADLNNNAVRLLTPTYTAPVLSIQSSHTGATYTLSVRNAAGAAATNGTVTVTELPPAALTVSAMAGPGWNCSAMTCTRSDALNGGASYPPITVTASIASSAASQFTNQATVSGGGGNAALAQDLTTVAPPGGAPAAEWRRPPGLRR
jgi:hypothetical protein